MNNKGFTLAQMLLVVLIITILATVLVPEIIGFFDPPITPIEATSMEPATIPN